MKNLDSIYKSEDGKYLIELRLNDLDQLFNTFDPSPFHDKDLDDDAERYIVESVRVLPLKAPIKLKFYLPLEHHEKASKVLIQALDNYFDFKESMALRELTSVLREGRTAFLFGLTFLLMCVSARTALKFLENYPFGSTLLEGLSIFGWVAMWRPMQTVLYDWWSLYRKAKIYEKIRDASIDICLI